jgi:hypothetical protein
MCSKHKYFKEEYFMESRKREYRKIYEDHYGKIPKDVNGVSYDIHHIDGDYTNNDINNLIAISIKEHYKIHFQQGDWGAAWAISKRFNIDPKEKSRILTELNMKNAAEGKHHSQIMKRNNTHPFQNKEFQQKMVQITIQRGNHSSQQCWMCERCGKGGKHLVNYKRYHGENCGKKSKSSGKVWVNNSNESKMIESSLLEQYLAAGWHLGRGSPELTPRRKNKFGGKGRA